MWSTSAAPLPSLGMPPIRRWVPRGATWCHARGQTCHTVSSRGHSGVTPLSLGRFGRWDEKGQRGSRRCQRVHRVSQGFKTTPPLVAPFHRSGNGRSGGVPKVPEGAAGCHRGAEGAPTALPLPAPFRRRPPGAGLSADLRRCAGASPALPGMHPRIWCLSPLFVHRQAGGPLPTVARWHARG